MTDYKELIEDLRLGLTCGPYRAVTVLKSMLSEAADAIEQLGKERDAAVADLDMAVNGQKTHPCRYCKNNRECCNCWNEDEGYANWEWRGVKEDDNEKERNI